MYKEQVSTLKIGELIKILRLVTFQDHTNDESILKYFLCSFTALRKTPVKPAAPMKPLYWTRILAAPTPLPCVGESDSAGSKPLWLEIEETKLDNIDEFTDLFSRQVIKAPVKKKVEVKTKIQPIKILDSKRSQNVGILAQSLHVEFSEIENAIYNFDTSVVSLEALQQIYELVSFLNTIFIILKLSLILKLMQL